MKKINTIDPLEVAKFAQHAMQWWNTEGPLKTLHDINPERAAFVKTWSELSGSRVLDVGCGGGVFSEALASEGAIVTGLDVESHAIDAAKAHAQTNELAIQYVCQPIEDYEDDLFDVITCMEMLEHVPDPSLIIKHCARLLKPGGYLFLSTINRTPQAYASVIIAAEYLLKLLPRQTHDFAKFIKPSELASMVRSVGLETVAISGMAYNPFTRKATLQQSVTSNYLYCARRTL
jgi:2-polyprenyl-6-hydroxyphenyl methylase/3-demethylubiquinone-9 3-methyltransferase